MRDAQSIYVNLNRLLIICLFPACRFVAIGDFFFFSQVLKK